MSVSTNIIDPNLNKRMWIDLLKVSSLDGTEWEKYNNAKVDLE